MVLVNDVYIQCSCIYDTSIPECEDYQLSLGAMQTSLAATACYANASVFDQDRYSRSTAAESATLFDGGNERCTLGVLQGLLVSF